jgi:hypothetical protein
MAGFSPKFELPCDREYQLMKLDPKAADFGNRLAALFGKPIDHETITYYADAIREAEESNIPSHKRVVRADDFLPEKSWSVLASTGYICDDPYTGAPGVTRLSEGVYRVTTRLATRHASSKVHLTLRLMNPIDEARLVFSPLLVRYLSGVDHTARPVKISDSGRIRNELQTMLTQALVYEGETIRVHFDRVDEKVMPRDKQAKIRKVLEWYKAEHPVWFNWLEIA